MHLESRNVKIFAAARQFFLRPPLYTERPLVKIPPPLNQRTCENKGGGILTRISTDHPLTFIFWEFAAHEISTISQNMEVNE